MSDAVKITVVVRADPAVVFRMFTEEVDSWWKRGPLYRASNGAMRFESGKLLEGDLEVGVVKAWEPGRRLEMEFQNWRFGREGPSEVEIRFEPIGDGTRVTVEHRGWKAMPTGAAEFRTVVGLWWGTLLTGLLAKAVRSVAGAPAS